MTEFRSIEGYPKYEISNHGDVLTYQRGHARLLKPYNMVGYLGVTLVNEHCKCKMYIHRLVAKAFIPIPDYKVEVNHKDGNRKNNDITNLEWVTHSENLIHACSVLGYKPKGNAKFGKDNAGSIPIINITTGEIFDSITQAADKYKIPRLTLGRHLQGVSRAGGRGYLWAYKEVI